MLGAREHQHLLPVVGLRSRCASSSRLRSRVDRVLHLRDELGRRVAPRDLDRRPASCMKALGELADLVRERRREQQVLPLRRQQREDLADVVDEAHVEHAVGLVEHEDLDLAQVDGLLLHVVEQAARASRRGCRRRARSCVDLRIDADAAEYDGDRLELDVLAVGAHAFLDLRGSSRVGVRISARIGGARASGWRSPSPRGAAGSAA